MGRGADVSCAEVCIDHGYYETNEFYSEAIVRARKAHSCVECSGNIEPGDQCESASGKSDGDVWTYRTCASCLEIREAFVCGDHRFGDLWESIREEVFPLWNESGPFDCLGKVETREVRDRLMAAWREWRCVV